MIRPAGRTDVNRSAVLAHLGAHGPSSRAELARVLGVSPALMTQLTKELLTDGLVVELDHEPSQGGRPARRLGLAQRGGSAIGVKVVTDHVAFVEVGLDGSVLRSASERFDAAASTVLADLVTLLTRFIAGAVGGRLLGVGVGVPGSVDRQGEGVVVSPQLGWNGVPLGETLRRAVHLPVLIENNVNALAMAERLYGTGRRHESFLVVTIGTGVGAGIVVDGVVLRGAAGGAGEIGHTPVVEDGPLCMCGNRGCLEALASGPAIARALASTGLTAASSQDVVELVKRGNIDAIQAVRQAGRDIGEVLTTCVSLINPSAIVLGGALAQAGEYLIAGVREVVYTRSMPLATEHLQITQSKLGPDAAVLGASMLAIHHALAPESIEAMVASTVR